MYFGLSEEQVELASTVRTLLERRADSTAVRAATESEAGYDVGLWQTLCEQIGVASFTVPEKFDGAGFSLFETGVVLEHVGYAMAPIPLLASVVAVEALLGTGDEEVCAELLPQLAAGEIVTLAWPGVTGAADSAITVSEADGVLSGSVDQVLYGDAAGTLLVVAQGTSGPSLHVVAAESVTVSAQVAMDTTLRFARIELDGVAARPVAGDIAAALRRAHLAGAAAVTCLQVGAAQRALDMTVAYAKERVQFGRTIGSFQALKHRMADMLVEVETSRSAAWAATYAVATEADDAAVLTASAASHCGDALMHVAGEAVQLHGGIAITWEHDISWVFKRAQALNQLFGLPHQHRALLPL